MVLSKEQNTSLPMEIDTEGKCGWDFSTALCEVSIQPTGCQTINPPNRPSCTSWGALNDNEVTFGVFPG